MRVFVYYNLHKKLWSIRALEGPDKGRVVSYKRHVILYRVTPKVSEAGRQRVLREGRKNVHAGLVGTLSRAPDVAFEPRGISYNPRKGPTFYYRDTGDEFTYATVVSLYAPEEGPPECTAYANCVMKG